MDGKFTILTTTGMLGDAIKNIVKEDAEVVSLMGPGIDPHTYQTTHKDVQKLIHADMIFYNGLYLEGKMTDLLEKMAKTRKVYAASDALHKTQLIYEDIFPIGIDPHIWFDVRLWKQVVAFISQKLQEARPESAAYYEENTIAYLKTLALLHQEVTAQMQSIPAQQRVLITAHDAFGYFGKAYDTEVVGLQGISTVAECGLKDIHRIVELILKRNIKAVFFETSVSDKSMRAVLEGCAHYGHKVKIGGCLYSDALGAAGTPAESYCGMIKANTIAIVNALK
ncbi:metal ABC transporter solute-binding protein, Zn/Mn family [Candidatus Cardinium hertigii]|uniref:metal ABC transporter solute-binding protein, Zn/Mn family n=1 Tax=Candidatus Cardinium hertigii TaxID=247481 RepID=UPI0021A7D7F2|nr:zinc ABC transporter substrate-binding protein [Candidatus Cardinium hertigii]